MLDLILGNNVLLVIAVVVIGFLVITLFTLIGQYEAVRWVIGIPVLAALVFSAFYS